MQLLGAIYHLGAQTIQANATVKFRVPAGIIPASATMASIQFRIVAYTPGDYAQVRLADGTGDRDAMTVFAQVSNIRNDISGIAPILRDATGAYFNVKNGSGSGSGNTEAIIVNIGVYGYA